MSSTMTRKAKSASNSDGPFVRRRGARGSWDPDEVAAHLMSRQDEIVRGLARKSPWVGLEDDTMASCYGHGAAVIARVAASGQRPEWRTTKDLERAQVAAYRHQALDHWKRVNTQSRRGERFTVAFDPERHAVGDTPVDRLFDQPDLLSIERDLLVELIDDDVRAFWTVVLREHHTFKDAGDRLGLTKATVMAYTRAGRTAFAAYLERRKTGQLCEERSRDVLAQRAGTATPLRAERGEAHLESCYACALVHEPGTSAFQRGLLGLAPTGWILRLLFRSGEGPTSPVLRTVLESSSGSRALATGLAAAAIAGTGVGVQVTRDAPASPPQAQRSEILPSALPRPVTSVTVTDRGAAGPPPIVEPAGIAASERRAAPRTDERSRRRRRARPRPQAAPSPAPAPISPSEEFGFERQATTTAPPPTASAPLAPSPTPTPTPTTSSAPSTSTGEFDLP